MKAGAAIPPVRAVEAAAPAGAERAVGEQEWLGVRCNCRAAIGANFDESVRGGEHVLDGRFRHPAVRRDGGNDVADAQLLYGAAAAGHEHRSAGREAARVTRHGRHVWIDLVQLDDVLDAVVLVMHQ